MLPFESIPFDEYIKYVERAEYLQKKGLHTDKNVIQLANMIYEKDQRSGG